MRRYEEKALGLLLDSYENSLLFRKENKVAAHIALPMTKNTFPQYFDESSPAFEEIHAELKELERLGLIQDYLAKRILENKTVKEFVELGDTNKTRQFLNTVTAIEKNERSCYIREFSIEQFSDSKELEGMAGTLGKIFRRFGQGYEEMDVWKILSEYNIYHTPNYVYVKGSGRLCLGIEGRAELDLSVLGQGIGISGDDMRGLTWRGIEELRQYQTCGKALTQNDCRRLQNLIEKSAGKPYLDVLRYMKEKNLKLEQEVIGLHE